MRRDTTQCGRTRRIWQTYKQRPHKNVRALRAYLPGHGYRIFLPTQTWVPLNHMNADMDAPFLQHGHFQAATSDIGVPSTVRMRTRVLYTMPCAIIASATFLKPAMFAPAT